MKVPFQMIAGCTWDGPVTGFFRHCRRCGTPWSPARRISRATCHPPWRPIPRAGVAQVFPHARTPADPVVAGIQRMDLRQQPCIVLGPRIRRSGSPALVPAGRDPQIPAHQPDGKRVAALLDHPIRHRDALAKHAAASRKKSRSLVTRANSRRGHRSYSV